ncbi:MAG: REP-associated tyrosine transposase, partial [Gaiellales bacterium]|nr:REP-associated tyrosine transposase [Gaiellales bacterium]
IERNEQLLEVVRHLPLNPVRAGLCQHPAQWRWSSHRAYTGTTRSPRYLTTGRVLALFDDDPTRARRQYARFVMDGVRHRAGHPPQQTSDPIVQAALERGSLPRS